MKILKEVIEIELFLLAFVGISLLSVLLITSKTTVGNLSSYVVRSGSMEPLIPTGSLILVEKTNQYSIGDVVTFQNKDELVTHRIVAAHTNGAEVIYYTKGDANEGEDKAPLRLNQVKGQLVFVIPKIGKLIMIIKTPLGFVFLIILPALIFSGFEIRNIGKEIVHHRQKQLIRKTEEFS